MSKNLNLRVLNKKDESLPTLRIWANFEVDNPELADFVTLSWAQKEFIRIVRANPDKSLEDICKSTGISINTYRRKWMNDKNFKRCLYVAYYDVQKYVAARARELLDEALSALEEIVVHSNNDNARIKAAKLIFQLPQNPGLSSSPPLSEGSINKMQRVWERAITYKEKLTEKPMWDEDEIIEGNYTLRSDHEVKIDSETLEEIEAKSKLLSSMTLPESEENEKK